MKHTYRKSFDHEFEAQQTAKAFERNPGIDGQQVVDVSVIQHDERYWVYIALEGEPDPQEVLQATGYERVDSHATN